MKIFLFFLLLCVQFYAQNNILKIGEPIPCVVVDSVRWLISSGQLAKGCYKSFNNIDFFFATIDEKTIFFISTKDSNFVTPEGFKIGDCYKIINSKSKSDIIYEPGWGYYSKLPSDWFANYGLDEASASHHIMVINSDSPVFQFFQRN